MYTKAAGPCSIMESVVSFSASLAHFLSTCALVLMSFGGGGCSGAVPHPTLVHVDWARAQDMDVSLDELERGRAVYVLKCAGCHSLTPPSRVTSYRWPDIVESMMEDEEVALTRSESRLIKAYLEVISGHAEETRSDE